LSIARFIIDASNGLLNKSGSSVMISIRMCN